MHLLRRVPLARSRAGWKSVVDLSEILGGEFDADCVECLAEAVATLGPDDGEDVVALGSDPGDRKLRHAQFVAGCDGAQTVDQRPIVGQVVTPMPRARAAGRTAGSIPRDSREYSSCTSQMG